MIDLKGKHIVFCGDIHGEFRELVFKATNALDLHDTAIIVCGDCGFGFEKPNHYSDNIYNRIKKKLVKNNLELYFIRGNHDNPEYFGGDLSIDLPRFKTVPDYELLETDRGIFISIGGATSIDRDQRLEYFKKHPKKEVWWKNERPIKIDLRDIPGNIIGVLSHEAPIQLDPIITRGQDEALDIYQNTIKDRDYLGNILKELEPSYWFYGHYHKYYSGSWGKTLYHCLGIMDFYEFI